MTDRSNSLRTLLAAATIVAAGLAAYHNSFSGPFVFDDAPTIQDNGTIRHLWPVWDAFRPPHNGSTADGRPLLNLSFALNYAIGGTDVRGYHVVNLAIHLLAGLVLFGIVRRTIAKGSGPEFCNELQNSGPDPFLFAFAVALIWTVHPLATESVTFISDRAESLMGLFYLLTLYCFVKGVRLQTLTSAAEVNVCSLTPWAWFVPSVLCCFLGMATKEVMVTAPVLVLLYDRTFVAGTFRDALRGRWLVHAGLASSWLLLGLLVRAMGGNRGQVAGFGTAVPWWAYMLTQCRAIVRYLRLAVWPHPLVFDYGRDLVRSPMAVLPQALLLLLLVGCTIVALRRRPVLGFLGAWFFIILSPSSSVVPLASQTMAEHRMYLPLAAVLVLVLLGIWRGLAAMGLKGLPFAVFVPALAGILVFRTEQRNEDYRTELRLWEVTVRDYPSNGFAHYNLGCSLGKAPGRIEEAIAEYREAVRLDPNYSPAHNNLANALAARPGGLSEAVEEYRAALALNPDSAESHNNLGMALATRPDGASEAMSEFRAALRIKPDYAEAHINLGIALSAMPGRMADAIAEYEAAIRANPDSIEAHFNLGNALAQSPGREEEGIRQYEEVLRIKPGFGPAEAMIARLRDDGKGVRP